MVFCGKKKKNTQRSTAFWFEDPGVNATRKNIYNEVQFSRIPLEGSSVKSTFDGNEGPTGWWRIVRLL